MAKRPNFRVVENNEFDDLLGDEGADAISDAEYEVLPPEEGISLDDALDDLKVLVKDAVNFVIAELYPVWEEAQEFMDGGSDVPVADGRSKVTATVIADAIRNLKPSMMRVFLQSGAIVEYESADPSNFVMSVVADTQTRFNNKLFWECGGYRSLLDCCENTLAKRMGVLKASYSKNVSDDYLLISNVSEEELAQLKCLPDVIVVSEEQNSLTGLYDLEIAERNTTGEVSSTDVPLLGFFFDDNATCAEDATVIGERRSVTVSKARSMGLEYDDWQELDDLDIESDEGAGEADKRRKYSKSMDLQNNNDPSNHRFLLTEVYAWFDLDGTGMAQLYRFWLGGTDYKYIDHERVNENPYSVVVADPIPGSMFGRCMFDILRQDQNVQTSILRATCDNAHQSNNRRLAVHENLVNMQDVMNPRIGAPIRVRAQGMIQEIGVESTLGTMLPLLDHLKTRSNDKVGVTNASMGLDPDALQSTDKDAVQNTIMLAQGQTELMCRNMAEIGLRSHFVKLLKLSMRHNPRQQFISVNGSHIPVDQSIFKPEMKLTVSVGLGNGNVDQKIAALNMIMQKQEQMIAQYGVDNPVCSVNQYLTATADLLDLMTIKNIGRYFNAITPELAKQLEQIAQQKAAAQAGEPPSRAVEVAETIRAQSNVQIKQMDIAANTEKDKMTSQFNLIKAISDDDFKRDQMAQDLAIESAKITNSVVDKTAVQVEQGQDRQHKMYQMIMAEMQRREQFDRQMQMQERQNQQAQQSQQRPPTQ